MNHYPHILSSTIVLFALSCPLLAQAKPDTAPPPTGGPARQSFLDQLQQYYEHAKDSGNTTAQSAAHWLGEQYQQTTTSASETAESTTKWLNEQYNGAVKAGDTTARNASEWVIDDVSKIGTWQYKVVQVDRVKLEQELNRWGEQRWECFSVQLVANSRKSVACLKRPHRSYLQKLPARDLLRLAPLFGGSEDAPE